MEYDGIYRLTAQNRAGIFPALLYSHKSMRFLLLHIIRSGNIGPAVQPYKASPPEADISPQNHHPAVAPLRLPGSQPEIFPVSAL